MIRLRIAPDFNGPTIEEWVRILDDDHPGEVEVRWTGTKADTRLLLNHIRWNIILVVPDLTSMERAAAYLGLPPLFERHVVESGLKALKSRKSADWRSFARGVSTPVARALMVHIGAQAIREGKKPNLRFVATECLLEGVSAVDADVMLSLRSYGAKP